MCIWLWVCWCQVCTVSLCGCFVESLAVLDTHIYVFCVWVFFWEFDSVGYTSVFSVSVLLRVWRCQIPICVLCECFTKSLVVLDTRVFCVSDDSVSLWKICVQELEMFSFWIWEIIIVKDTEGGTIQYVFQRVASEKLYKNHFVLNFDEANILVLLVLVFDFVVFIAGLCFYLLLSFYFVYFWGQITFSYFLFSPHSVPTFILLFVSLHFCSVVDSFFSSLFALCFGKFLVKVP